MGIVSDPHASYKLLAQEFKARGYQVAEEIVNGKLYVTYTGPNGEAWTTRAAQISYPFTLQIVKDLSTDKHRATIFAQEHGVTTPDSMLVDVKDVNYEKLDNFLSRHNRVVVKPLNRSLSLGLTTDITSQKNLMSAVDKAAAYSQKVVVQEQVFGEEIRFAMLNGKVVSTLLRRTPRVVGDGVSSIEKLLKLENSSRREIKSSYVQYPVLNEALIKRKIDRRYVPKKGEVIELSRATMISGGCSVYDVLDEVNTTYVKIAEGLARMLGTGFIVADIFVKDFKQPAAPDNYWFIEFNTSPVLKLFYSCRDGSMHDIVPPLVNAIHRRIHSSVTIGSFEEALFPELDNFKTLAKVDTGAFSGALGCSTIELIKRGDDRILQFSPGKKGNKTYETKNFQTRTIRSSTGHRVKRYLIDTTVVIKGKQYPISLGLANRKDMKFEILLGRRFLREHNMLVDVRINQEYDTDGETTQ